MLSPSGAEHESTDSGGVNMANRKDRNGKLEKAIKDVEKAKRSLLDVFDHTGFLYDHEIMAFNNLSEALSVLKNTGPEVYAITRQR